MKKIETPSKKNFMDDLKNSIEDKINSFICAMEANIDGVEENLNKGMEDLKKDKEGLIEGWTKFLQERIPNDEKVVEENYDEKKKNVNNDLI